MCPLIVFTERGQYLSEFQYISPGHDSKLPFFISLSHVYLTGKPDAACLYQTSASSLGRSYALYAERVRCIFVLWCNSNSLVGFREKRHILVSSFSLQPVRINLPTGENTVTSFLVNKTVQSASNMRPTPTSVLVRDHMINPIVVKRSANCGIVSVDVADDLSTCPVDVPILNCEAFLLGGICGADGAM